MQNDISLFDPKMSGCNHTIQYGRLLRILDKNTTLYFLFNITFLQLYVPLYLVEGGVFQYYRMKMISLL